MSPGREKNGRFGTRNSRFATAGPDGFTLVEVLIGLTVTVLLGAALMSLVLGQSRFYAQADDAIGAQQNLRGAGELMASELRMAAPADLLAAAPDSVSVRFDMSRAIVCDVTGPDEATIFAYDTARTAGIGDGIIGTAYSGPLDSTFLYADAWRPTLEETGSVPQTVCATLGAPPGEGSESYRTASGWSSAFGQVPDRGSAVRFYSQLTYRLALSIEGTGIALWRGSQELAWPFADMSELRYVLGDGTVVTSASGAALAQIHAIRIDLVALGEDANRYDVNRRLIFDVPLRN